MSFLFVFLLSVAAAAAAAAAAPVDAAPAPFQQVVRDAGRVPVFVVAALRHGRRLRRFAPGLWSTRSSLFVCFSFKKKYTYIFSVRWHSYLPSVLHSNEP